MKLTNKRSVETGVSIKHHIAWKAQKGYKHKHIQQQKAKTEGYTICVHLCRHTLRRFYTPQVLQIRACLQHVHIHTNASMNVQAKMQPKSASIQNQYNNKGMYVCKALKTTEDKQPNRGIQFLLFFFFCIHHNNEQRLALKGVCAR